MSTLKIISPIFHAITTVIILILFTAIGSIPILLLGLLKLVPNQRLKIYCTKKVDQIAILWSDINNIYLNYIHPVEWKITGIEHFDPQKWYLVIANHQSWLDIVVLQRVFNRKIPVLKFFIKDQLKWIPFLGFSWWAMGCPFMKRYSPEYLAKHPHKKGKDLLSTKKALTLFKQTPATLMSFVEGTRYTDQKRSQQNAPYQQLLKPKAGGIGFVIDAMNQHITQLLDVTIIYPNENHSLWNFLCQRVDSVQIHIRQLTIPSQFLKSTLFIDEALLSEFRSWLNQQWLEKDQLITKMKTQS
jgi:1-acyl-sn-glycerol-3-phosphate acyltransferase